MLEQSEHCHLRPFLVMNAASTSERMNFINITIVHYVLVTSLGVPTLGIACRYSLLYLLMMYLDY